MPEIIISVLMISHKIGWHKLRPGNNSFAERNEKLTFWIQRLIEESENGAIIVVEGSNDERALRRIGIRGPIVKANARRAVLADRLSSLLHEAKEAIVLTDFDRSGRELAGRIARLLMKNGATPNMKYWVKINGLISNEVKDIEGLATVLEKIKKGCVSNVPLTVSEDF